MKTAIYIRVSTEDQAREGTSLEVQREFLEGFAKRENWDIYRPKNGQIYEDDGYSGKSADRPALKRLLEDAKRKKFDVVVVYKIDRFARNNRLLLNLVEELEQLNIGFKSATESFDTVSASGKMALSMLGTVAQFERDRIIERVFPGMVKGVEKGNWQGSRYSPYGYKYDKEKKLLRVVKKEADTVKLIFTMYLANKSTSQIANYFYKKRYKTRSGGKFHSKFICDVLKNKTYIGKIVWNKYSYDQKQKTRKGYKYVKNSSDKVIEAKGRHKAIIDKSDFYLAQKKLEKNRRGALHRNSPNDYPLSGLLFCNDCNHKFRGGAHTSNHRTKKKKRRYLCGSRQEHGITCLNKSVKAEEIEPIIFNIVEKILSHPDIKNGRTSGLMTECALNEDQALQDKKQNLQGELKDNINRQEKLSKTYLENLLTEEAYKPLSIDLRIEEDKLRKNINGIDIKIIEKDRSEEYQNLLKSVIENFDKTKEEMDAVTKKEFLQLIFRWILIKDKKIVTMDLYQPFKRYLKEQKCNINQIIAMGTEKSYILRPMADRWMHWGMTFSNYLSK